MYQLMNLFVILKSCALMYGEVIDDIVTAKMPDVSKITSSLCY